MYDSLCHSHTRSWPKFEHPKASHSPVGLTATVETVCWEILQKKIPNIIIRFKSNISAQMENNLYILGINVLWIALC